MTDREILSAGENDGLQVWEVQQFPYCLSWLSPVEQANYGRFHEDYAYLTLKTEAGKDLANRHSLNIWIGKQSEQEKRQDARLAARQMRKKLGVPDLEFNVERQGKESSDFGSHFPGGIRYESFDKDKQEKYDKQFKQGSQ